MDFRKDPIILILGAVFTFSLMLAGVKWISPRLPLAEIIFFRSLIPTLILAVWLKSQGQPLRAENSRLLVSRALLGVVAMFLRFYAIAHLALGDASVLGSMAPVFVVFLSLFILKERPGGRILFWTAGAVAGVALILRPQFDFFNFAGFVALLSSLFGGGVVILIHRSHRTDPAVRIAFYFMLLAALASLPLMVIRYVPPTLSEWGFLIVIGLLGTAGQVMVTKAYGIGEVSRLAPFSYVATVLAFFWGSLFWGEIPTTLTLAGSTLGILSCMRISRLEKGEPVLP